MNELQLTIGADPELFVSQNGEITSVIGQLGGSKEKPLEVEDGAVQEDNVLAEFNITPAASAKEMVHKVRNVLRQMGEMLTPKGYALEVKASHLYRRHEIMEFGPEALVFGCDPDYNAWLDGAQNPTPSPSGTLRTAGGHVHVGSLPDGVDIKECVRAMDIFLGLPSVLLDEDFMRRSMYGTPGAYREKPYGFEYRSLSNFWIKEDETIEWVYNQTHRAIQAVVDGTVAAIIERHGGEEIQRIITENDQEAASRIIGQEGL